MEGRPLRVFNLTEDERARVLEASIEDGPMEEDTQLPESIDESIRHHERSESRVPVFDESAALRIRRMELEALKIQLQLEQLKSKRLRRHESRSRSEDSSDEARPSKRRASRVPAPKPPEYEGKSLEELKRWKNALEHYFECDSYRFRDEETKILMAKGFLSRLPED